MHIAHFRNVQNLQVSSQKKIFLFTHYPMLFCEALKRVVRQVVNRQTNGNKFLVR